MNEEKVLTVKKTIELLVNDPKVNKQIGIDRLTEAGIEFADRQEDGEQEETVEVPRSKSGLVFKELRYYTEVIESAPGTKGLFRYNEFDKGITLSREFKEKCKPIESGSPLNERNVLPIRKYLECYGVTNKALMDDAILAVAQESAFHPIRELLNACHQEWDGKPRIDTLMVDYFACPDNVYTRQTIRKMLCAAVARAFKPGTKFDYMLVIIGPQGCGKSTFIERLGMGYYSDSFSTVKGKEAYESVIGVWIGEMAELSATKKADVEATKHFLSKTEDYFRPAYGRNMEKHPRQIILFGTSNKREVHNDGTGGRRFWPNEVGEGKPIKTVYDHFVDGVLVKGDLTPIEVRQIWGEAVSLHKKNEPLFLAPEVEAVAKQVQLDHKETDDRVGQIQVFLDTLLPENWEDISLYERRIFWNSRGEDLGEKGKVSRGKVCVAEIFIELFGRSQGDMTPYNTRDLHDIMKNLEGWGLKKSNLKFNIYGYQRSYVRQTKEADLTNERGKSDKRRVNHYEHGMSV